MNRYPHYAGSGAGSGWVTLDKDGNYVRRGDIVILVDILPSDVDAKHKKVLCGHIYQVIHLCKSFVRLEPLFPLPALEGIYSKGFPPLYTHAAVMLKMEVGA